MAWALMTVIAVVASLAIGDSARRATFDMWQAAKPRDLTGTDVRVVLIDSESLAAVGPWPWPRYYLARLTEELSALDPRVIGFDILFAEPDRVRPDTFVSLYPELSPGAAAEIEALPPMDQLFGQVIGAAPVVLAHAGVDGSSEPGATPPNSSAITGSPPVGLASWPAEMKAIPALDGAALGHGLVNGRPDPDGVIRGVPLLIDIAGQPRPGFALELARVALGAETVETTRSSVALRRRRIAVDKQGRLLLHFGQFPPEAVVSAADVLGRQISPATFADKIVLVGVSAAGTSDVVATPLEAEQFGTLVQAQAVDAMIRGGWLQRPSWAEAAEWAGALMLALLALWVGFGGKVQRYIFGAAFFALPLLSWLAFQDGSLLLDPSHSLIVGGGALAGVVVGLFAEARIERERLRETLLQERIQAAAAEGELQAARAIQLGMVPQRSNFAGIDQRIDLDALLEPAKSVGGDFFDVMKTGDDLLAFVMADVTGKGVPAALFMAMSKALTRAALIKDPDLADVAAMINAGLLEDNSEAMSVTMLIGILDLAGGAGRIVCAGHEEPLVLSPAHGARRIAFEGGPPFGVAEFPYPVESMDLLPGETLVLLTDGITEAQNAAGELYGRERALAQLRQGRTAAEICQAIRDDVRLFEAGTEATDDLTIMVIGLRSRD